MGFGADFTGPWICSAQQPIPEKIDNREIAVRVTVMHEVKFLLPLEPGKSPKPWPLRVIFLVEEDVRVERGRASGSLHDEEVQRQDEVGTCSDREGGNQEKRREIALFPLMRLGNEVILGIDRVVVVYVIAKELRAQRTMSEPVVQERL